MNLRIISVAHNLPPHQTSSIGSQMDGWMVQGINNDGADRKREGGVFSRREKSLSRTMHDQRKRKSNQHLVVRQAFFKPELPQGSSLLSSRYSLGPNGDEPLVIERAECICRGGMMM